MTSLGPGVSGGSIQIKDINNNLLYEQSCNSKKEINDFVKTYGKSKKDGIFLKV